MKTQLLVVSLIALAAVSMICLNGKNTSDSKFEQWKLTYAAEFDPSEEVYRRMIFEKNLQIIQNHNADLTQTYKMAVNQFTIYSQEEFKLRFLTGLTDLPSTPNHI